MDETSQKTVPERKSDAFSTLLGEWREVLTRAVDEAERFTRDRPVAGLGAAFVAGLVFGNLFRKR